MHTRSLRWMLAAAFVFLAVSGRTLGDTRVYWYSLTMQGSPVGYMRMSEANSDGTITTRILTKMTIKRGAIPIELQTESEFVETADGQPISASSEQKLGTIPSKTSVLFDVAAKTMKVTTSQGGAESATTKPWPTGDWMTPASAERFLKERIKAGDKTIEYSTMDLTSGTATFKLTNKIGDVSKVTIGGKDYEARRVDVVNSLMPAMSTVEYIDENAVPLRSETKFGAIPIVTELAGPEIAGAEAGQLPPELMVSTFVAPDKPINNARASMKATYLLGMPAGQTLDVPSGGPQDAIKVDAQTTRVVVDQTNPAPMEYTAEERAKFLASSAAVNLNDEEIKKLSAKALKDTAGTTVDRAEACRRFVYRFIKNKNLDTAFASASEVARTHSGDCTEHGVLLVALLREAGIPARGVVGVIYADSFAGREDIFGYHMWAQALLEIDGKERWVDFDGTLPPPLQRDATHIALGYSDFGDESSFASMSSVAAAMGQLSIKIESVK